MGSLNRSKIPSVAPDYRFPRGAQDVAAGLVTPRLAVAVFDPSANTAQRPIGAYGLGVFIPDNAIIVDAWYDVITTFTSAGADAGTIALSVQSANDIVAAIAISAAGDIYDAGLRGTKIGTYALDGNALTQINMGVAKAAAMIKLTAERELTATVATQALTAGKLVLYVKYVIGA